MNVNTLGGVIWVNLINTQRISNGVPIDLLEDTTMFRGWLEDNGLAEIPTIREQQAEFKKLRDVFLQMLNDTEKLNNMNLLLETIPIIWRITSDEGKLAWTFSALEIEKAGLVQIVQSFLETIDQKGLERVRQCTHEECILYFLDTSKAGRRRWCNMETCGNKHKAYLHYHKKKSQG